MRLALKLPQWFYSAKTGLWAAAVVFGVLTAATAPWLGSQGPIDAALLYLVATLVLSAVWGYRVGLLAAVAADVLVNYFFVPPIHRFTVQEPSNIGMLVLLLIVAAFGASMLSLLRRQYLVAETGRVEVQVLLDLAREMARAVSPGDALNRLATATARGLGTSGCSILVSRGRWTVLASTGRLELSRDDEAMASEALRTGETVRSGGETVRRKASLRRAEDARVLFVPFSGREQGVLRISGRIRPPRAIDVDHLLRAFADETSIAVERAKLADEAARAAALERADELKSALLSSVSHDLRSPLTAIKASVGALRDRSVEWSAEDTQAFLEAIETQTDRLTGTVTDLLEVSRLEGGAVSPRLEPVDVAGLLTETAAATAGVTRGRSVQVEVPSDLWMRADYRLALQALVNLVENAARYSTPGGSIALTAARVGPTIRIRVCDEGPGIPEADLPHIFEKFYRGAQSGKSPGTGLGLAIVQATVKLSGGSISVESSRQGTAFTLTLPASRAPSP